MDIRLSGDLDINIWLSWNLNMNIRFSQRVSTGICNRWIVRTSIESSNGGKGSTYGLTSITNWGSKWYSGSRQRSSSISISTIYPVYPL